MTDTNKPSVRALLGVAGLAVLLVLAGCVDVVDTGAGGASGRELEIHHIDVGQADSTLLVTPGGETILVDTGDVSAGGEGVIAYLDEQGIERVDHLVATHPDADHIGGHAGVIEHFETEREGVGAVYGPGLAHTTQTYQAYLDAVERYDHEIRRVEQGDSLPLDAVDVTVLNPPADSSGGGFNYNSVTLTVEFDSFRYLITGDAGEAAESRMVQEQASELDADVYQVGHHGARDSSTRPFLSRVDPEAAIISSPVDSPFGHPHEETLRRLAERDIQTYWTGIHGDIVVTTDGSRVSVAASENATTDPGAFGSVTPRLGVLPPG